MARNGSGTYNLLTNSWNPATNGVSATAVDWQNLINDVASALTQSLSADGQTPITGNLNAGNNKITGLAAGSATGDSLRWEQLFSQGQPVTLASAATTDIGAQNTVLLNITGTTTITSFGTNYNGPRYLRFDGVLTLTHNATTLILPGGANIITTAAGDSAIVVPNGTPANGWRVVGYQRGNGTLPFQNSVNTTNITDASITPAKLSTGAPTWDVGSNVGIGVVPSAGRLHVSQGTGTAIFGTTGGAGGYGGSFENTDGGTTKFVRAAGAGGNGVFSAGVGANSFMFLSTSGDRTSVIPGGTTLLPEFQCRAWVNFNGTGTVAIRASGNVSSITDNGTGNYTVNFTTAMPDANYAGFVYARDTTTVNALLMSRANFTQTTSTFPFNIENTGLSGVDVNQVYVVIFR
jgi:hypothetical protein